MTGSFFQLQIFLFSGSDKIQNLLAGGHNAESAFAGGDKRSACIGKSEELFKILFCKILKAVLQNII